MRGGGCVSPLFLLVASLAGCLGPSNESPLPGDGKPPPGFTPDCSLADAEVRGEGTVCAVFFKNNDSLYEGEASLATHPAEPGTALVSWTEWLETGWAIHAAVTPDGGATWRRSTLHDPTIDSPFPHDAFLYDSTAAFLPDGTAVVLYAEAVYSEVGEFPGLLPRVGTTYLTLASSGDGGLTWTYRTVWRTSDDACPPDFMHLAVAPDTGRLYAVASACGGADPDAWSTWLWSSDDGGATWSQPSLLFVPGQGARAARVSAGPDGLVVVLIGIEIPRLPAREGIYASVSHDAGASWSTARIAENWTRSPAAVRADGLRIDHFTREGSRVLRVTSEDAGATWGNSVAFANTTSGAEVAWWAIGAVSAEGTRAVLIQHGVVCEGDPPRSTWGIDLAFEDASDAVATRNLVGPLDDAMAARVWPFCPESSSFPNEYGGLAFAADGSLWAAWADPRAGDAPGIAVAHLVPAEGDSS